jgi:fatty-acyl-CoA synthase
MAALMTLTKAYWPADTTVPVLETTVGGVLRAAAADSPDALAMVGGLPDPAARRRWTFRELLADAESAAWALAARFPEWIVLEYGAALAGLSLVTVNPA